MDETTLTRTLHDLAAGTSLHAEPALDARVRARRLQNQHRLSALCAVVVLAVAAFGVRDLAGSDRHTTAGATAHVLKIQQVVSVLKCDPTLPLGPDEVMDAAGSLCYTLAPTGLTIHPKSAAALYDTTQGWTVQVGLDDADRVAFGTLTTTVVPLPAPRNQLAMVLDGVVLSAPTIQSAILGGEFVVQGDPDNPFSQAAVDRLAAELSE